MENNRELKKWISDNMSKGYSKEEIRAHLIKYGYDSSKVDIILEEVKQEAKPKSWKNLFRLSCCNGFGFQDIVVALVFMGLLYGLGEYVNFFFISQANNVSCELSGLPATLFFSISKILFTFLFISLSWHGLARVFQAGFDLRKIENMTSKAFITYVILLPLNLFIYFLSWDMCIEFPVLPSGSYSMVLIKILFLFTVLLSIRICEKEKKGLKAFLFVIALLFLSLVEIFLQKIAAVLLGYFEFFQVCWHASFLFFLGLLFISSVDILYNLRKTIRD